jgi:hypothetical protein
MRQKLYAIEMATNFSNTGNEKNSGVANTPRYVVNGWL